MKIFFLFLLVRFEVQGSALTDKEKQKGTRSDLVSDVVNSKPFLEHFNPQQNDQRTQALRAAQRLRQRGNVWGGIQLEEIPGWQSQSIADLLGFGWNVEYGGTRPGILLLGLEKTPWTTVAFNDPPFALMLRPTAGANKANILLSTEAAMTKLDRKFKHAQVKMDDIHLWMKIGTGFQEDDVWLRIEFARPPPNAEVRKINGVNWYISTAEKILTDPLDNDFIYEITLLNVLNTIDDIGIPKVRHDGSEPYSALPGWLPKQYWNCYTALNELLVGLGNFHKVDKPPLYYFLSAVTFGAANGRRYGDGIYTEKAKATKELKEAMEDAQKEKPRIKHNRECGMIPGISCLWVRGPSEERVSASKHSNYNMNIMFVFTFFSLSCICAYIQHRRHNQLLKDSLLWVEDV